MNAISIRFLFPVLIAGGQLAADRCVSPEGAGSAERLRSAACYAADERWKEAELQYRTVRQANSRAEEATVGHADALIHLGRPFEAAIELSELLESSPDSVPALKLYAGLMASSLENETRAALLLERYLKLAPSDPEAWRAMGDLLLGQRRAADALHYLETAVRLAPRDALLAADLARGYAQAQQTAKADALFRRAAQLDRTSARADARVSLMYAGYLLDQNQAAQSIPLFDRSLLIQARSADAHFGRARAYELSSDWVHAEADALAAIRLAPKRMDAHLLLSRVYRAQGNEPKAEESTGRAKQLGDEQRELQSVKRRSREALRLYFEVVQPLLREQKFAEAIPPALEIVEQWPSFSSPLFLLGVCYSQTGQRDQALTFFNRYLAIEPNSADGHAALGVLLLQSDRKQEALRELERAATLDPALLEPRKAIASIHLAGGDAAAAVRALRAANPDTLDGEAHLLLAEALLRDHQSGPALQEVDLVLRAEPGNALAVNLKRRIASETK